MNLLKIKFVSFFIVLLLLVSGQWSYVMAADDFGYPELSVSPLASKRVQIEAVQEQQGTWREWLPITVSGGATLIAALNLRNDPKVYSSDSDKKVSDEDRLDTANAGTIVGAGWLATTTLLAIYYKPYLSCLKEIHKMPTTTVGEKLTRERLAEECLEASAKLSKRLTYLSALSNFAMSGAMIDKGGRQTMVFAGISLLAAFAPIVFELEWGKTYKNHLKYKKSIYGPVTFSPFLIDNKHNLVMNGLLVSFTF